MGFRTSVARGCGLACSWILRRLVHREASTLPGRVALAVDPGLIAGLAGRCREGSLAVCGTNGKTTTNNVLATALELGGARVLCNRAGANMETGVASALLPGPAADRGCFEVDELSTPRVLPQLRPRALVLLNLFRDQLDRSGEIDRVQDVIVEALAATPGTALVYNGDDPLCHGIALRAARNGNPVVPFGIRTGMGLPAERVAGGRFCQVCGAPLEYSLVQYGQLGHYRCPKCSFSRPRPRFEASEVRVGPDGVDLSVRELPAAGAGAPAGQASGPMDEKAPGGRVSIHAGTGGAYMAYNLLAAWAAASLSGVGAPEFQRAVDRMPTDNGRLQRFCVDGRQVTLNLAKNPTGFNQNIALLGEPACPRLVYVAINDNYNDGRDVSWLWDVDFERLADPEGLTRCVVGGQRANDMQVRLKYAGIDAPVVGGAQEALGHAEGLPAGAPVYVLTNYSALWPARQELTRLEDRP